MQASDPASCHSKDEPGASGDLLMGQFLKMDPVLYDTRPTSSNTSLPDIPSYGSLSAPTTPAHTHNRSISSESGSSLVERTVPSRTHPSLQAYQFGRPARISPEPSSSSSAQQRRAAKSGSRKRPVHQVHVQSNSDDEEDLSEDLEPLDPDATEEEKKAYNRRRNTLAARRSRAKRANEFQQLKEENTRLTRETAVWKERALMMERVLAAHGYPIPSFSR